MEVETMLLLSRKRGEQVVIGDTVTVTVIEIKGNRVKLGFNGPPEVPIHREELYRRIDGAGATLELAETT
jgi:carbon storage regulator